jgi:rare lipoprotein A
MATGCLAACASVGPGERIGASSHGRRIPATMRPYEVDGRWYYPAEQPDYDAVGLASFYGPEHQCRMTADGETFDMRWPSAAHRTLPLPSLVEVTNLDNGRSIDVRVNDRGPFVGARIIDLSRAAAQQLGFSGPGTAKVRVRYIGPATGLRVQRPHDC